MKMSLLVSNSFRLFLSSLSYVRTVFIIDVGRGVGATKVSETGLPVLLVVNHNDDGWVSEQTMNSR